MGGFRTDERIPQQGEITPSSWNVRQRPISGRCPAGGFQRWENRNRGTRNPSASQALSHAEVQTPPEGDKFDDLLALGRQFGNFTVK